MAEAAKTIHSEALIIGDTPGDGVAAITAGFHFLAVCTGAYQAEDLEPYNPALLVENFAENEKEAIKFFASLPT